MIRNRYLAEKAEQGLLSEQVIGGLIGEHQRMCARYNLLDNYYKGKHSVIYRKEPSDGRPNNKIIHNYAKYIVVMSVGYLLGDKIKYTCDTDISALITRYKQAGMYDADEEIAKDMSVFGRGYEILYLWGAQGLVPKSYVTDPRNIFVIYGDTPEREKLFALYYYPFFTEEGKEEGFCVNIYTKNYIYIYQCQSITGPYTLMECKRHFFYDVPVIEYRNNEEATGDFEDVISLMDAYNLLQSDRVNDVERFVQAILFLKNFSIEGEDAVLLQEKRILQATGPEDVDAKWLVNGLDQNGVEIVRKTIEQDIHKFSFVPAVTDQHFAGNASGVAMKYKLIGFSQMNKIKKRYMERGLRQRLALVADLPNFKCSAKVYDIQIEFTHSLPVNDLETAQMVSVLEGIVKRETLLKQLSFVTDAKNESAGSP